jgi:molybdopterin-guanine dinucleotide biosynthesis protein A
MDDRLAASAVILAGGRSRRFGSDKLAVEIDGAPLLHHVTRNATRECAEVLVVGPPGGLSVTMPEDLASVPRVVLDSQAFAGPLVALVAAATSASHDRLLLLGGDMPDVAPRIMHRILAWEPHHDGACLMSDGWAQPFPMGLDRRVAIAQGTRLVDAGERSLRSLIATLSLERLPEAEWRNLDPLARSLRDIDRPEDVPHW